MNLRLILRIARTELAVLFYSPVAWLLLVAFTCQVGFDFMNILTEIVKIKALGNTITFSVTAGFVLGLKGIYEVIQETIYLYIPLLTMNLMSREYSSGSIKLLYSSPVSSVQIITGKFVSMVVFALIFVIILALPTIVMFISVPHVDITLILAGIVIHVSVDTDLLFYRSLYDHTHILPGCGSCCHPFRISISQLCGRNWTGVHIL